MIWTIPIISSFKSAFGAPIFTLHLGVKHKDVISVWAEFTRSYRTYPHFFFLKSYQRLEMELNLFRNVSTIAFLWNPTYTKKDLKNINVQKYTFSRNISVWRGDDADVLDFCKGDAQPAGYCLYWHIL